MKQRKRKQIKQRYSISKQICYIEAWNTGYLTSDAYVRLYKTYPIEAICFGHAAGTMANASDTAEYSIFASRRPEELSAMRIIMASGSIKGLSMKQINLFFDYKERVNREGRVDQMTEDSVTEFMQSLGNKFFLEMEEGRSDYSKILLDYSMKQSTEKVFQDLSAIQQKAISVARKYATDWNNNPCSCCPPFEFVENPEPMDRMLDSGHLTSTDIEIKDN